MRFTKLQGCGNDYVYVNCFTEPIPADPKGLATRISDRHFGVGSDGLILVLPSTIADARMRMFNADGSEGEMCGNGVRCVAKLVYERGIARKTPLTIETGRGVLTLDIKASNGVVQEVRVDMGEPILAASEIPVTLPGERVIDQPISIMPCDGVDPLVTCVSMGNPHAVLYCRDVAQIPLATVGPTLETAAWAPRRINVHFVQLVSPTEVIMRTWERGSGITLACGTGACAVAVAGVLTNRTGRSILAHLPGGDLRLDWNADSGHVFMTGPAVEVFQGEWPG